MTSNPADDLANQFLEKENRDRQQIALLLDNYLGKDDRIFAQKTLMGNSEAYIGSVTLEWLDSRVRFASQMPLFRQKFDLQTNNIVRDDETIDEIIQRPLDWSRQAALTQYLAARKSHKFPAVLVVVSPPWVDDPQAAEWDKYGIATKSAAEFTAFDKNQNLGLLNVSQEIGIYALDGQHRLMGVQGLMSLIKTGILQRYNKNKKAVGAAITIEDLAEEYQIDPTEVQKLAREKIGIEFIPAVLAGETRQQAQRRVRSIFVHVNLMAVTLSQGQLALLNEDNGFAIAARKIAVTHPLLKDQDNRNPRINWDSATVAVKSTVLTTLQALQDMSERYLEYKFPHWKPEKKGLIPMRPEDEELKEGIEEFRKLFDNLATLPSYKRIESGEETLELRRFGFEKPAGEGNILFRPVGQVALANALGILVFRKQLSLTSIFDKLRRYDVDEGFSHADNPESAWYGILYDPNKRRMLVSGRELASKLIVYLVAGIEDDMERAHLRQAVAQARTFEGKAISLNGRFVRPQEVGLPPVLS
ncbi:MAG: DGQHR domain-containing protein [Oscillatoriaceae cyanobacterium Prado104]|jgi:DGQHR domain-containing protein|nr:DGQHR domain-containing protein [Oscillatoriaceae cyanobacterium Prado104]